MFYRAIVEDNKDPDKCKRVKVRIFGIHASNAENTSTEGLPWAEVMGSTDFGLISGVGVSSVLRQGTMVWVFFKNDDPNYPVVIGTVAGIHTSKPSGGFSDPDGVYPSRMGSDLHPNAQSSYGSLATINTASGHLIELDDTQGSEKIKITHKTGTYIEIKPDGSIFMNTVADMDSTVAGNFKLKVTGTTEIESSGNFSVKAPRIDLN